MEQPAGAIRQTVCPDTDSLVRAAVFQTLRRLQSSPPIPLHDLLIPVLQQHPADLAGRHAQRFKRGKKEGVPLGSDVDDAVDHQVAADQHQDGRGIEGEGLLLRLIQTGAVVGEVGGETQLRQPLILQNLLGLLFQLAGLVEGDAEGDAGL